MRAIRCHAFTGPKDLRLEDIPDPVAGAGQVLIAVEACGLGFVDGLLVQGKYQVKDPLPFTPGGEMAGRVLAVGEGVSGDLVGKRVAGIGKGGLAEKAVLPAVACAVLPEKFESAAAAASLINYGTAIYGFEDCGALKADETVLVLGASGGVGMAAIDVARGMGATVIAAASSEEKRQAAIARGAHKAIDYTQSDWRKALTEALDGRGLDVVYDPVSGAWSEAAFRSLAPGGRHLVIGFASGEIAKLPLNLALLKRSSLVGVDWGGHVRADAKEGARITRRLMELVEQDEIAPRADSVHGLAEAPEVIAAMLARKMIGKPVIQPQV
ncbi:MAG: NADPH:quinone oxidoreductase family protein [Rhodoblastus sp.]|nr:NADPH:quinone oxidoreductase family protein [Rhodoblastus sp.]